VQEALHQKSPAEQQSLQMALMTLRGFLAASRLTQEDGGTTWEPYLEPISPPDMSRIGAWSQTLKERREAASLSRHKLAELSGIPEGALEALESGTYAPSQMSLLHLLSVPELDLETQSLPWEASASDPNLALNCWLAPGFDPVKMIKDLALQVNGHGGHIEQSYLYMDHMSAAHWCSIAEQKDYDAEIKTANYETTSVYGLGHPLYYKNVIDVMSGNAEPETDGREGLKSLEVLIAAYLSARDGKAVSLPLEY